MKHFSEWIKYKKENNIYPLISKFKIINNFDFKSICICPKGWGGANVNIKTEEIDVLINELQQTKKIIENFQKSVDKSQTM